METDDGLAAAAVAYENIIARIAELARDQAAVTDRWRKRLPGGAEGFPAQKTFFL